jgi:hypothetical protein
MLYDVMGTPVLLTGGEKDTTAVDVLVADALVIVGAFKGTPTCIPPPVITTPAPNEIAIYLNSLLYLLNLFRNYGVLTHVLGKLREAPGQIMRTAPEPPLPPFPELK